jgi:serine kinase of HPr protein (carbohydrate metabolism regulator)
MRVRELIDRLKLRVAAGDRGIDRDVTSGYCGDLLSEVMAHAPKGCVWLTVQGHQNIIAVAVLREMAAIVLTAERLPDEDTVLKADQESIPVLLWPHSAYELCGRLYSMGLKGEDAV